MYALARATSLVMLMNVVFVNANSTFFVGADGDTFAAVLTPPTFSNQAREYFQFTTSGAWSTARRGALLGSAYSSTVRLWVTAEYNGSSSTLPGPNSSSCQWEGGPLGSTTPIVFLPGDACFAGLPSDATFTVAYAPRDPSTVAVLSVQLVTSPVATSYGPASHKDFGVAIDLATLPADVGTLADAFPPPTGVGLLMYRRRQLAGAPATDSFTLTVLPLLADGDISVYVQSVSSETSAPPVCTVGPDGVLLCTGWTRAFDAVSGGGALFVDGNDPCNATRMAALNTAAPPRIAPDCLPFKYELNPFLWVLMVPAPSPLAQAATGGGEGGARGLLQASVVIRTVPDPAQGPGRSPLMPVQVSVQGDWAGMGAPSRALCRVAHRDATISDTEHRCSRKISCR
jgi:hypothetical protein